MYLEQKGYCYSLPTLHKYMNSELGLKSIVRRKNPGYMHGKPHKVFENKLKQDFHADSINQKWCTDFTYLFLKNGDIRYNCSIIDLYDRSVVASITDRRITSGLAILTLQKALDSQPAIKGELILHSDQGSQYTSKAFIDYCESVHVTQSMSKAGYPYDNAPMERYFNTLKNECTNLYEFKTEEALYRTVEEFAYVTYNHVRPHSFNGYRPPVRQEPQHNQSISSRRSRYFLATSVTKKLDHNRRSVQSIRPALAKIKVYMCGWLNYYGIAEMKNRIEELNKWLYHRIRMCIWKQWKKPRTKVKNLRKMGVPEALAWQAGNSRRGYWFTTQTVAVNMAMTKERLISSGFYDLAIAYQSVHVNC